MGQGTKSNAARQRIFGRTDEELLDGLDDLVRDAVRGDSRAVGIIAVVYGPMLNDEARDELGPRWEDDSADILQTMFLTMCEGRMLFPSIRGAAIPWMQRAVREIARKWVRQREEEAGPGAAE
jgi:hypothetical protein